MVVAGDMADPVTAGRVRDGAVERFGGIDVWVNAASVGIAGRFGDEPVEEVRRLIDTNVYGYVLGARAALAQFSDQGSGTLVNVASLLGIVPNPLLPTYVMSKFAVRGLSLSLQQDRSLARGVHVCSVLPGPVDTPFFERAANHTGRRLRAIAPASAPERVAAKIVSCARRPRREVTVGVVPRAIRLGHRLAPRTVEGIVATASAWLLLRRRERAPDTSGALFAWTAAAGVHGPWRRGPLRRRLGEHLGRALPVEPESQPGRCAGAGR